MNRCIVPFFLSAQKTTPLWNATDIGSYSASLKSKVRCDPSTFIRSMLFVFTSHLILSSKTELVTKIHTYKILVKHTNIPIYFFASTIDAQAEWPRHRHILHTLSQHLFVRTIEPRAIDFPLRIASPRGKIQHTLSGMKHQ